MLRFFFLIVLFNSFVLRCQLAKDIHKEDRLLQTFWCDVCVYSASFMLHERQSAYRHHKFL